MPQSGQQQTSDLVEIEFAMYRRRVIAALETMSVDDLRQLISEIEEQLEGIGLQAQ